MSRRAYPKLIMEDDDWDQIAVVSKHGLEGWWKKDGLADLAEATAFLDLTGKESEPSMGLLIDPVDEDGCPYVIWKTDDGYAVCVWTGYT